MQQQDPVPSDACSAMLSMEHHPNEPPKSFTTTNECLQSADNNKGRPSHASMTIDDEQNQEQVEESGHSSLHGAAFFDMLSTMQFNCPCASATPPTEVNNNFKHHHDVNASSSKFDHDCPAHWQTSLFGTDQLVHDHLESTYPSVKESIHIQTMPTSGLTSTFLNVPVSTNPTKMELVDQRLLSSYSNYLGISKEDHCPVNTLTNSANWLHSLQLENMRSDCSLVNDGNLVGGAHVDRFLEYPKVHEESIIDMKPKSIETTVVAQDEGVFDSKYSSSTVNVISGCHTEEQLLYALNEGCAMQRTQTDTMFDHTNLAIMGYNDQGNGEASAIKASESSIVMGVNMQMKTSRKRGVRGGIKNSEERENQRMTHIAVERNRRRQMNEHLRVLRALMPPSYIQRGDQASIIGGAIDFVRELEQLLQCLESQKRRRMMSHPPSIQQPLDYASACENQLAHQQHDQDLILSQQIDIKEGFLQKSQDIHEEVAQAKSPMVDIEVKVVEKSQALIKILSQQRPRQLLLIMIALQDNLHFSILHTNVTTIDNTVLYSFTVKIDHDDDFSANRIADIVHEVFIEIISQVPTKNI